MCYVIIGLKQPLVTSQSQAREARHATPACKCRQVIPSCSHPITGQQSQTCYPSMYSADELSQHAVTQSQARKARQAIPACSCKTSQPITGQGSQTSYSSMHSADKLSHHALQSIHCIKETANTQNNEQADTAKQL